METLNGEVTNNQALLDYNINPDQETKNQVYMLQKEINDFIGKNVGVDEYYGPETTGAIEDLQKELGLPVTGQFDAQTAYQLAMAQGDFQAKKEAAIQEKAKRNIPRIETINKLNGASIARKN